MNHDDTPICLSVITTCFNSRATIERTIRSVLLQKHPGIEYIIVDAGSTDGTQSVIQSFGSDIDIFVSEPDHGISDGFNKGIALARGGILSLLNSDDWLLPGALNRVLDYFQDNKGCQVLHGDLLLYRGDNLVKRMLPAGRWWYPWRLVLFNHPATFVKKTVYDRHGLFSLEYRIAMDVEIFLRWLKSGVRIEYLSEPLAAMQFGGMSSRMPYDGYREVRRSFIEYGYPKLVVWALYGAKCFLHHIGNIHTDLVVHLKKYSQRV